MPKRLTRRSAAFKLQCIVIATFSNIIMCSVYKITIGPKFISNVSRLRRNHKLICTNYYAVRMRKKCYLQASCQNSDTVVGFGDPDFYMIQIFWRRRSVDIYHVTLTFDPVTLNTSYMLRYSLK